jgi:hypothetical protein
MSPEQAQGLPADARSDVFSFGAVLYEMATGTRAFTGENGISMLSSVLRDEPRRALELTPDLPAILSDTIHRCLQKDPNARFQTMAELRDNLLLLRQLSQSGSLYAAPPAALPETVVVPPKKAPIPWLLPAIGGLVLVLLAIGAWLFTRSPKQPVSPGAAQAPALNKPSPSGATPETPDPQAPAAPAARLVNIPDGTRIPLTLQTEILTDAEPGMFLTFTVTDPVKIDGEIVVAKGAVARGELLNREKKKQFLVVGRGQKITIQMSTLEAPDGARLKLRDTPQTLENQGPKSKTVAVSKGTTTVAFTSGPQAVRR